MEDPVLGLQTFALIIYCIKGIAIVAQTHKSMKDKCLICKALFDMKGTLLALHSVVLLRWVLV